MHQLDSEQPAPGLVCKNNQGYQNLIQLVSRGFTEGFYSKPRVDEELLKEYSEGLIALSACLAGEIPRALLLRDDYGRAKQTALCTIQFWPETIISWSYRIPCIDDQNRINPPIIRLSKETGIPLVVTNDAHYLRLRGQPDAPYSFVYPNQPYGGRRRYVWNLPPINFISKSHDEMAPYSQTIQSAVQYRPDR